MRYNSFKISNFKGIKSLNFKLKTIPESSLFTLIGLNESGKTTILEAMSYWYEGIGVSEENFLHTTGIKDPRNLIPRAAQYNFTGNIKIEAEMEIEESDKPHFNSLVKAHGFEIDWQLSSTIISYSINYQFDKSKLTAGTSNRTVNSKIVIKKTEKTGRGKPKITTIEISPKIIPLWSEFCALIKKRARPIIYYPNFLFEFPEKIFIDSSKTEDDRQNFYYKFLQDVLDSIDEGLNIKESILDRFVSQDATDQKSLRSLTNRMASALNNLMKSLELFDFKSGVRNVVVEGPIEEAGRHYVQVQIKEHDDTYDIRERSLGFRWFFTFALLTQFRIHRLGGEKPLFIFDEPASNLHQTAQQRLLKALEKLTDDAGSQVIYATHSHHLIDPRKLESAYIVKNEGLKKEDDIDYKESMTDVKIYKYREFVDKNPNEKDYFQPVLDVLEYRPSSLENVDNCVILEGKNDFYTLKLFNVFDKKISVLPAFGVDKLETILALYYGWGKKFIVILDSDKAGRDRKEKFKNRYGLIVENRVFTLSDIDPSWHDMTTESIFSEGEKLEIQQSAFPESTDYEKSKFNVAIQECLINSKAPKISKNTKDSLQKIAVFARENLKRS